MGDVSPTGRRSLGAIVTSGVGGWGTFLGPLNHLAD
jgi:hypothetical protein